MKRQNGGGYGKLCERDTGAVVPLFAPVIVDVVLQVHGEVDHTNLNKMKTKCSWYQSQKEAARSPSGY